MSLPGTTTRVICNRCGRATDQAGGHDTTAGCIGSYPLIQRRIFSEPNVTIGAVGGGALRETASEPFAQSELGNAADNWAKCYADAIDSAHHEDVDAHDAAAGFVAGYMYRKHEERPDPSFSPSKCAVDASSMWDKGFAAGIALQEKCDAQSKAVPGPVVPQLEGLHAKRCSEGHHPIYMHQDLYCPACVANRRLEERIADGQLLRAQLADALEKRDLAIAHDVQPYPTAWACEQACKTISTRDAEIADLRARLEAAEDKLEEYRLGRLGSL